MWLLIGLHVVYALFMIVWLFVAGMSAMGFNDASVFNHTFTWLLLAYLFSYPLGVTAAIIGGWMFYKRQKYKVSLFWNAYPMLWILSLIGIFQFS